MQANNISCGVIITTDPYSDIIDPDDKNTSLLFSDAATATVLSAHNYNWKIKQGVFGTDGSLHSALYRKKDEKLMMNGRAVFEATMKILPQEIDRTLIKNNILRDQIDKFVVHQASRYMVEFLSNRMGLGSKMPFKSSEFGNTVASSIPLVFNDVVGKDDNLALTCGFGVGFSWGINILERSHESSSEYL